MKFLKKQNVKKPIISDLAFNFLNKEYILYKKEIKKNRKNLKLIRPGISLNKLKNSIIRDKNNSLIEQYININLKKGKKVKIYKNVNLMIENLFLTIILETDEFNKYDYYNNFIQLYKNDVNYSNINWILNLYSKNFKSIFEIKTIKNNKKLKLSNKYTHEIVYIPKERRLKYVLKSLSFYKNNFNNYNFWERIFWSVFKTLINSNNSFLKKRKEYIYLKAIKFFKKNHMAKK